MKTHFIRKETKNHYIFWCGLIKHKFKNYSKLKTCKNCLRILLK